MRNVFVSYSHRLDQDVVDEFRRKFGNDKMVFSDRSLENKDLSYLSDDTINEHSMFAFVSNSYSLSKS